MKILGVDPSLRSTGYGLIKTTGQEMVDKMTPFIASLNEINGVTGRVVWDSAGRDSHYQHVECVNGDIGCTRQYDDWICACAIYGSSCGVA